MNWNRIIGKWSYFWIFCFAIMIIAGCGGGSNDPAVPHYTIGGTVNCLTGSGLVLQNNGSDDLSISADGNFTFATSVVSGTGYNVTVKKQPTNPIQKCIVSKNTGTVDGALVDNLAVSCMIPLPRFAYVANYDDKTISLYTVDADTGQLRHNGYAVAGTNPHSVTVDPSGKFAYVANAGDNTISVYTINQSTGALTAGTPVAAGTTPYSVTVDPSGKFAYAANVDSATISVYTINQTTGAFTPGASVAADSTCLNHG